MHFCQDELTAFAALLPGLAILRRWLRERWFAFRMWRASRRADKAKGNG